VDTVAILPIKSFSRAKQRLAPAVAGAARAQLAEAMASDVLDALARVAGLAAVVVVTADEGARALARAAGVRLIDDPEEAGQSAATAVAIAAVGPDFRRALLVAGDCPALDPLEVDALLARPAEADEEVVIVPDRHRTGTNALLLAPPDVISPAFGPGSRGRHLDLAAEAAVACTEAELPSLALDVDDASDIEALRAALAGWPERGLRTRAVLEGIATGAPG
jgi:2-phospho-L-lactate/phosphoenolpyruvate guanylyltransferase